MSEWWRLEEGTEVRPSRAREAFWRCEQQWARFTRDMVGLFEVDRTGPPALSWGGE